MDRKIKSLVAIASIAAAGLAVGCQPIPPAPQINMTQPVFTSLAQDNGPANSFPAAYNAAFTIPWTVIAPNGVCSQTLTNSDYNDQGGPNDPILGGPSATYTLPLTARAWNGGDGYWLDYGRGGENAYVTVKECNGLTIRSNPVHVVLDVSDDQNQGGSSRLRFSPTGWQVASCSCFLGGTATYTTIRGASFSFLTPYPLDSTGVRVALLMPEGPSRGSAAIYIDNNYYTTISTYHAGTNINRVINYQFLLPGTQTHVVRVVNLATPGHPRIDIDATIN